jgi:hypothetical protein
MSFHSELEVPLGLSEHALLLRLHFALVVKQQAFFGESLEMLK